MANLWLARDSDRLLGEYRLSTRKMNQGHLGYFNLGNHLSLGETPDNCPEIKHGEQIQVGLTKLNAT